MCRPSLRERERGRERKRAREREGERERERERERRVASAAALALSLSEGLMAHVSCALGVCGQEFVGKDAAGAEGVVDKQERLLPNVPLAKSGLACDPDRLITDSDRILFVSTTTSPKRCEEGGA